MNKLFRGVLVGLLVVFVAFSQLVNAYHFDPESRVFSDSCAEGSNCVFEIEGIYVTSNGEGESSFSATIPEGVTSITYIWQNLDESDGQTLTIDLTEFVVPDPEPDPETTFEEDTYIRDVPFETEYEDDPTLKAGEEQVKREGEVGKEQVTVIREIRVSDGAVIDERVTNYEIIVEPVSQIVLRGTKEAGTEVDLKLTRLTIDGGNISPEFDNQTLKYQIKLDEGVTEIEFDADYDDSLTVTGLGRVDVKLGQHEITLKNGDGKTKTFKFTWTTVGTFKFEGKNLTYDAELKNPHNKFTESELLIDGNKYVVYVDEYGNTIVPLKDEAGKSQFYLYSKDKGVLAKFDPVEINGVLYNRTSLPQLSDELIKQYGLEKTTLSDLNIDGYKINKDTHKGKYIIVLTTLQGKVGIYEYNQETKKVTLIRETESISEDVLKNYFSKAVDKKEESKVDWIMVGLLSVLLVVLIILVLVILNSMKQDRDTMMKLKEAKRKAREDQIDE